MSKKNAFNLIDALLAMILVGVLFSLTIPVLNNNEIEHELVSNFSEFNDTLQGAVDQWKHDRICPFKVGDCLFMQSTISGNPPDFSEFTKYMKIAEKVNKGPTDVFWLPKETLNYYGTKKSKYDFRTNPTRAIYLTADGKIFSVESDSNGFWIVVDVNGKKPPNRIGKDTFHMTIGYNNMNDINYNARDLTEDGICGHGADGKTKCDPQNVNPTIGNGASPTSYVILNKKLPDFKELSKSVPNFIP